MEIWWSDGSKKVETCWWTTTCFVHTAHEHISCWWRWCHRIRPFGEIQINPARFERSSANDVLQSSKDSTQNSNKHFLLWSNYVFDIASIYSHGKRILRNFTPHQKHREQFRNETDVWHIWKIDIRTIRWDFWSVSYQLGRFSMETTTMMKKSTVSRMQSFTYFRIPCHVLERWTKIHIQILSGKQVDVVQEFTAIQNFGHNWWWVNGIRVEISPGFMSKMCEKPEECTKRIMLMSMFNEISWRFHNNERECESNETSVLFMRKDFHQEDGHSSDLEQKKRLLMTTNHKKEWDKVAESFFRFTSPLSRGTLKSEGEWKLSIHFCADGGTIETIFRKIISVIQLSIYGTVSDLCEEFKVCNVRWRDLYWQSNLTHCLCQQVRWWRHLHLRLKILHKMFCCKSTVNEWIGFHNKTNWQKMCTDAKVLKTVEVKLYFMTKAHWRVLTIYRNHWHVVSTLCHEMKKKQLTWKVGFEGTPKFDPC